MADVGILDIFGASIGLLSRRTRCIVFPRCLGTITWPPLVTLTETPDDEQWRRYSAQLDESRYFVSAEDLRKRVSKAYATGVSTAEPEAGDLAATLIQQLAAGTLPAVRKLTHSFYAHEANLATRLDASQDGAIRGVFRSILECHQAVAVLMRDIVALRAYEGPMHFACEEVVNDLKNDCDEALEEARRLWRDLRISLDAAASAGTVSLLGVAQDERRLADAERERADDERREADEQRDWLTSLSAVLVPAAFWPTIYGANVALPGNDKTLGTTILLVLMLSSVAALLGFVQARKRRRQAQRAERQRDRQASSSTAAPGGTASAPRTITTHGARPVLNSDARTSTSSAGSAPEPSTTVAFGGGGGETRHR